MNTAEYLARVGYEWLIEARGIPREPLNDDWGDEDLRAAEADRDAKEQLRVARELLALPEPTGRSGEATGIWWGERPVAHAAREWLIDWSDRVPGLKTWAGQQKFDGIVKSLLGDLAEAPQDGSVTDWFAWQCDGATRAERAAKRHAAKTKKPKKGDAETPAEPLPAQASVGASGIDSLMVVRALDAGFSLNTLGIPVPSRPFTELLAIVGLQSVPLVSFAPRVCGFVHGGSVWRFRVEDRDGWGKVWGPLERVREHEPQPVWSIKAGL